MAKKKKVEDPLIQQGIAEGFIPKIKFNMDAQEQFANDRGVIFEHWASIPSAIGAKDRGDYRRPDSFDDISENGFLYKKVGEFVGTVIGNSDKSEFAEGGIYDDSTARLVIPKFYRSVENPKNKDKQLALLPGDRVYAKNVDLFVDNYQRVEYNPDGTDILQFPVLKVEYLIDSRNIEYKPGIHFNIDKDGNIRWIDGKENPGIDPQTGRGRIYGIRYTYLAFWYIQRLINEVRVTNTKTAEEATRLPYHATIQREYVYHNRNRGDKKKKQPKKKEAKQRQNPEPKKNIDPQDEQFEVKVDVRNFDE